jgi:CBS domain containing-hemolysin-like protein
MRRRRKLKANERANRLAARAHEHVKRTKAARAMIAELDVYTDACVVIGQATQIVDILLESARSLSFETWLGSTRERPDDQLDGAQEKIAEHQASV